MAKKTRAELQALLEKTLGSRAVYFQPPENLRLTYPCIIYELSNIQNRHADNTVYLQSTGYGLTVIDKNPDSEIVKRVSLLPGIRFDRAFKAEGLNHTVFTIYY